MNNENKFLITLMIFIILCLSASVYLSSKRYQTVNEIIELNNKKETLEIENKQLKNILGRGLTPL